MKTGSGDFCHADGSRSRPVLLVIDDLDVSVTHPSKVIFPDLGLTKRDVVEYFLAVAPGVLGAVGGRPMALKRYVEESKRLTYGQVGRKGFEEKRREVDAWLARKRNDYML